MKKPKPIKLAEVDITRFWSKVDKCGLKECWEWQACRYLAGYGQFSIGGSHYGAHRVAYVIVNGDTELYVLHTCNHPWCCNPNHLYAGTQKRNMGQCHAEGRYVFYDRRGEKNGSVKLIEFDVQEIRRLYVGGWLQREIAEEYGISQSMVSKICRRKNWGHI